MVEREAVVAAARERLGVVSRVSTGEYGVIARLLDPHEEIRAMAIAQRDRARTLGSGAIAVATERRLLIVLKRVVSRREVIEEIPLDAIHGARLEAANRIAFESAGRRRTLELVMPPAQAAAMVEALGGRASRYGDVAEVLQRRMGRLLGPGVGFEVALAQQALDPDEAVLDGAWTTDKPSRLVVVGSERVVLVPQQGLRQFEAIEALPYAAIDAVRAEDDDLVIEAGGEERRLAALLPEGAAETIAGRIAHRLAPAVP